MNNLKRKTCQVQASSPAKVAKLRAKKNLAELMTSHYTPMLLCAFVEFKDVVALRGCCRLLRDSYKTACKFMNITELCTRSYLDAAPFARTISAFVEQKVPLDFVDFKKLERLNLQCNFPGHVTLPPQLLSLTCRTTDGMQLPPALQCATFSGAPKSILEQLANCQSLTQLDLYDKYDPKALAECGLAPNLHTLRLGKIYEEELKFPDSLVSLEMSCKQIPPVLPAGLRVLKANVCVKQDSAEDIVVPGSVRDFEITLPGFRRANLVLPEGLKRLSVLNWAQVNPPQSLPDSLRFLHTHATHAFLPIKPNNIENLELYCNQHDELDPDLATKCPEVRTLRLNCEASSYHHNLVGLFNCLPLAKVETLHLEMPSVQGECDTLDFSRAPNLKTLDMRTGLLKADLGACHRLTHLKVQASSVDLSLLPKSIERLVLTDVTADHCPSLCALTQLPNLRSLEVHFDNHWTGRKDPLVWTWDVSALCERLSQFQVFASYTELRFEDAQQSCFYMPWRSAADNSCISIIFE